MTICLSTIFVKTVNSQLMFIEKRTSVERISTSKPLYLKHKIVLIQSLLFSGLS